jgi:magnesium transporter
VPYTLFYREADAIRTMEDCALLPSESTLLWCDLNAPTREEEVLVESLFGIEVPTRDEMNEIEPSNRLYMEGGAVFCTATLVTKSDTPEPELHAVTFILTQGALITLRYSDPYSFTHFSKRLMLQSAEGVSGHSVMVGIVQAIINRLADIIENSSHALDHSNRQLFRPTITDAKLRQRSMPNFEEMLREIGIQADLLSKSRESLLSLARMLGFLVFTPTHSHAYGTDTHITVMQKDIPALLDQADSLSGKVAFLLDATLGLVDLQQTAIIKIFSVASVVFLPPTLVASIYGMNFQHMPELGWRLGYPLAIILMFASAWLPYRLFKKKKWL